MTLTSKVLKEITQLDTIKTFTNLGCMKKKKKKTFNSTFIFIAIYRTKIIPYLSVTLSIWVLFAAFSKFQLIDVWCPK